MKVKMYSKDGCIYCEMARNWFEEHRVPIEEIKLNNRSEAREFYEKYGCTTVPQIFIDEERIGGYSDLRAQEQEVKKRLGIKPELDRETKSRLGLALSTNQGKY